MSANRCPAPRLDGDTYDAALDGERLGGQLERVRALMADHQWRTLAEIARAVGGSEAGVSARLRDLRKERYGRLDVQHERIEGGLWRYRVMQSKPLEQQALPLGEVAP